MDLKKIINSLRRYIANNFPFIRSFYRIVRWRILQAVRRTYVRNASKMGGLNVDPYKIFWIDTRLIKKGIYEQIQGVPNTACVAGVIKGGDWDRAAIPIDDIDIIKSAKQKFRQGLTWEETEYYQNIIQGMTKGMPRRGCNNKEDVTAYFKRFDHLYEQIKKHGYKQQNEIVEPEFGWSYTPENEIAVHIDRDGHILFCNGAHRFSIALALDIKRIPVKVCIRHKKWHEFSCELLEYMKRNKGTVYQPITHPDLQHMPSAHCEERFEFISPHIPSGSSRLLDLGANWGYFCHRFEDIGYECHAVENDPENFYFLKKLKEAEYRNFKIIDQSILAYKDNDTFDVVLALNIFHHFLKKKEDYDALIAFLQRIKIKMMIFEPHDPSEPQMETAYRNYEPELFVNFIKKHANFKYYNKIATARDGRSIYKLYC